MGNDIKVYNICPTSSKSWFYLTYKEKETYRLGKCTILENNKIGNLKIP